MLVYTLNLRLIDLQVFMFHTNCSVKVLPYMIKDPKCTITSSCRWGGCSFEMF